MIAPTTEEILRIAGYVLLPVNDNRRPGPPPFWRSKNRWFKQRFEAARIHALAESGLLEIGPRSRWARLTEAGRKELEIRQ